MSVLEALQELVAEGYAETMKSDNPTFTPKFLGAVLAVLASYKEAPWFKQLAAAILVSMPEEDRQIYLIENQVDQRVRASIDGMNDTPEWPEVPEISGFSDALDDFSSFQKTKVRELELFLNSEAAIVIPTSPREMMLQNWVLSEALMITLTEGKVPNKQTPYTNKMAARIKGASRMGIAKAQLSKAADFTAADIAMQTIANAAKDKITAATTVTEILDEVKSAKEKIKDVVQKIKKQIVAN